MNQEKTAIQVHDLTKSYGNVPVLDHISFDVKSGTIYSLLGSNGAGKTTTVKILTTLIRPDSGTAKIKDFDVLEQPHKIRRCISLTGQYAAVDEALTGRENLIMSGRLNHIPKPRERAGELLKYFELEAAADRYVSTYSGGMRRKLDIAMSLVSRPDVIFLDEPTTGLDPQSRRAMWSIIKSLKATGVTVFLTTQYLEEAEQLADKIAILNKGAIMVEGTSSELRRLLPQGLVEFTFDGEGDCKIARELLQYYEQVEVHEKAAEHEDVDDYEKAAGHEQNKLTVVTDGTFKQAAKIFRLLDEHNVLVREFTQKRPTLEDVFLTLIGAEGGRSNVHEKVEGRINE